MIPLIDVMLVLLIIFIIAAPLLTHAVKVDLPVADSDIAEMKPETIQLGIESSGRFLWNGVPIEEADLAGRLQEAARHTPVPELHIQADAATPYEIVARAMAKASRAGVEKIGFVSKPEGAGDRDSKI